MINASTLLDAYVDVNLLLVFVCVLWFAFSRALDLFGLSYAVTARLRMLRMVFLAVLLGPLFAGLVAGIGRAGHVQPAQQVNLTDFIVAQYLQVATAGAYCVVVADPGTLTTPVNFAVRIIHS